MPFLNPPEVEQPMVQAFFGRKDGVFVDVGANDPYLNSQSYHLEQLGWSGILVEPLPEMVAQLREKRRAPVFQVACSSPANVGKSLPLYVSGPHSSFSPELMVAGSKTQAVIEVPVTTLDLLLEQAGIAPGFDLLSVDVEGHEVEVLSGFDFARWHPRLILIEDHVMDLDKHRLLNAKGYRLLHRTGLNAWYVPQGSFKGMGFGVWLSFVRKYYLGRPFRHLREALRRRRAR